MQECSTARRLRLRRPLTVLAPDSTATSIQTDSRERLSPDKAPPLGDNYHYYPMITLADLHDAQRRIRGVALRTRLIEFTDLGTRG